MIKSESALILQLWRAISEMEHTEELFRWLLQTIVQQCGVEIGELWTYQAENRNRSPFKLCELVHRDVSPPWNILTGEPTVAVAEHIIRRQRNLPLQTVQTVYSSHRATLLQRYGVNYCAGYGVRDDLYLSAKTSPHVVSLGTGPQKLVLLIFSRRDSQESIKDIQPLLQQTLLMAERCHLLRIRPPSAVSLASQDPLLFLKALTPRHTTNAAWNPLALSLTISDKRARIFYNAIDDRKTVAELANIVQLSAAEIAYALQFLLEQGSIQLYEPGKADPMNGYHLFKKGRGKR